MNEKSGTMSNQFFFTRKNAPIIGLQQQPRRENSVRVFFSQLIVSELNRPLYFLSVFDNNCYHVVFHKMNIIIAMNN